MKQKKWKDRLDRVGNNRIAVSFSEDEKVVKAFNDIEFDGRKIIFCPMKTDYESAFYLGKMSYEPYYETINKIV